MSIGDGPCTEDIDGVMRGEAHALPGAEGDWAGEGGPGQRPAYRAPSKSA